MSEVITTGESTSVIDAISQAYGEGSPKKKWGDLEYDQDDEEIEPNNLTALDDLKFQYADEKSDENNKEENTEKNTKGNEENQNNDEENKFQQISLIPQKFNKVTPRATSRREDTTDDVSTPCAFFFSKFGCSSSRCRYSHSQRVLDDYKQPLPQVINCPNPGCKNTCIGSQCGMCHKNRYRGNVSRKRRYTPRSYDDRELHLCPIEGCENICKGRVCRECHFRLYSNNKQ